MSNRIRNAGRRVGRAIRTAGRRYVEMMAKCDPNGYGYYVWQSRPGRVLHRTATDVSRVHCAECAPNRPGMSRAHLGGASISGWSHD